MLINEQPRSPFWKLFFLQLVVVYPVAFFFAWPALGVITSIIKRPGAAGPFDQRNIWNVVVFFAISTCLGFAAYSGFPALRRSGKWVWLPPVFFLTISLTGDLISSPSSVNVWGRYFYSNGSDEHLVEFLITWPVAVLLGYSLGIYLRSLIEVHPASIK